jgi:primosomal replication protein N
VSVNRVELAGQISATGSLRHTPAGIPAWQATFRHASQQVEAGRARQVECEMAAQAFGAVAEQLAALSAGTPIRVAGFLDRAGVRNPQPVLHVTEFELLQE